MAASNNSLAPGALFRRRQERREQQRERQVASEEEEDEWAGEPDATEDDYGNFRREMDRRNRQMIDRTENGDWCKCGGNCFPPLHVKSGLDLTCCHASEPVQAVLLGQNDLFNHPQPYKCITEHGAFFSYCLYKHGLSNLVPVFTSKNFTGDRHSNASLRHTAYRSYTNWVHGKLGFQNRRSIPQCVTKKIKQTFPEQFEHLYRGYEEVDLDSME